VRQTDDRKHPGKFHLGDEEAVCIVQEAANEPRTAVVLAGDVPEWLDYTTAHVAQDLHLTLSTL
jgi:hypothetical protein